MNQSFDKKFNLKWNDYEYNLRQTLLHSRRKNEYSDMTLLSEDLVHIPAHKLVLSGSSRFFETILQNCDSQSQPLIYLKGVNMKDLNNILNFIYTGEVSVKQEDLNSFLAAAADLKIKGLTEPKTQSEVPVSRNTKISQDPSTSSNKFQLRDVSPGHSEQNDTQDDSRELSEDRTVAPLEPRENKRKKLINTSLIKSVGTGYSLAWSCLLCKRIFSSKKVAVSHLEMVHSEENQFSSSPLSYNIKN